MALTRATERTIALPMYDEAAPDNLKTGLTLTCTVSKDGGAFAAATNSASELGTTGVYALTLTADEMDADVVTVAVTATGACDQVLALVTDPSLAALATASALATVDGHVSDTFDDVGDVRTVVDAILADTGTTLPAAIAALDALIDAVKASTDSIGSGTITVVSQTNTDGSWNPLVAGDDYVAGRDSELSVKTNLDLDTSGAGGVTLNIGDVVTGVACTVTGPDDDGLYTVTVDHLTAEQTRRLRRGQYVREFEALDEAGLKTTFGRSRVQVSTDAPAMP